MNLRAIIPVKSLDSGKWRLSAVLDPAERRDLNRELLDHMLAVTSKFPGARNTIVTSPDRDVLDRAEAAGAEALLDATGDLNSALAEAARHAAEGDADGILIGIDDLEQEIPAGHLDVAHKLGRRVDTALVAHKADRAHTIYVYSGGAGEAGFEFVVHICLHLMRDSVRVAG